MGDVRQRKFQKITKTFQTSKQHTNNHAQRDMKCAFKRFKFEHYGEHCFKGFVIKPLVPLYSSQKSHNSLQQYKLKMADNARELYTYVQKVWGWLIKAVFNGSKIQ